MDVFLQLISPDVFNDNQPQNSKFVEILNLLNSFKLRNTVLKVHCVKFCQCTLR